jgi:hypothetical protein
MNSRRFSFFLLPCFTSVPFAVRVALRLVGRWRQWTIFDRLPGLQRKARASAERREFPLRCRISRSTYWRAGRRAGPNGTYLRGDNRAERRRALIGRELGSRVSVLATVSIPAMVSIAVETGMQRVRATCIVSRPSRHSQPKLTMHAGSLREGATRHAACSHGKCGRLA